jgi:transposase, IS30 family
LESYYYQEVAMRLYQRLRLHEREEMARMKQDKRSNGEIAKHLGRDVSTIGREFRRQGSHPAGYVPELAQTRADRRACGRKRRQAFRSDERRAHMLAKLEEGWSPEQIAGRLKQERSSLYLCTESIYQWIYSKEGRAGRWCHYLHRRRKQRLPRYGRKPRRGGIIGATPVHARPETANARCEFGHWETDLVVFIKAAATPTITTMVERKSRFALLRHNADKFTSTVITGIRDTLTNLPPHARKSATFDRGSEFAAHRYLHTSLAMQTYFCDPHSPWQKGANENFNGRLRRFLPKGIVPSGLSQIMLDNIQNHMNNTPRKVIGFLTPAEAFHNMANQNIAQGLH